jgi:hypothetical protein
MGQEPCSRMRMRHAEKEEEEESIKVILQNQYIAIFVNKYQNNSHYKNILSTYEAKT